LGVGPKYSLTIRGCIAGTMGMPTVSTKSPCTRPMPDPDHQFACCQLSNASAYTSANSHPIIMCIRSPTSIARSRLGVTIVPRRNGMLMRVKPTL
jgi:hypothetical protein